MKNLKNNFYVYLHRRKDNNEVFYVGKGKGQRGFIISGRNQYWRRTAKKYGWYCEILKDNLFEDEALKLEIETIALYGRDNLCNFTDGGDGTRGMIHLEETKEKISKSNKGKPKSEEHRKKLAKLRLGKPSGNKGKIGGNRGKKFSKEHVEKIKNALKGRVLSEKGLNALKEYTKNRPKVECPHCKRMVDIATKNRWHFDNCKLK